MSIVLIFVWVLIFCFNLGYVGLCLRKKKENLMEKSFTSLVNVIWKWNIIPLLYTEADLHLLIFIERPQLCK